MASMTIDIEHNVVIASGDLDLEGAPIMRRALHQVCVEGGQDVVLDMARVSFMDSTGLRELLKVAGDGHHVTLRDVPRSVRLLLELAGVESLFTIEETAAA